MKCQESVCMCKGTVKQRKKTRDCVCVCVFAQVVRENLWRRTHVKVKEAEDYIFGAKLGILCRVFS